MLMDFANLLISQDQRLIKLTSPLQGQQELFLDRLGGCEGISQLFHFDLNLLCLDHNLELKTLIGKPVLIEIALADGGSRYIHGYINRFDSKGSEGSIDGGVSHYSAHVVPWLWMLSRRYDSRIFQDQTVEEVITSVFSAYGALPNYQFHLSKSLKPYSYLTQYRENDLNFVLRLLEEEGLLFYFEHSKDGHTLIITDDSTALSPLSEQERIRFHSASVTELADSITDWHAGRQLQSGKMAVQTFDYKQPNNLLPVSLESINRQGDVDCYEIYDFPGQYTHGTLDDGEARIRLRLEALEAQSKTFYGDSNCRAMLPGYTFELTQHPLHNQDSAEDRHFLLLSVEHFAANHYLDQSQQAHYSNRFSCIRKKIPYRSPLNTPRPCIHGPQTAFVVGPQGEEIFTDSLGRVKVQFHWDRYASHDDKSSCWVRVVQAAASGGFGMIAIPRIGDEVMISFIDGDPDRPLVTGSLYNAQNMPPWDLPGASKQLGLMGRSFRGGTPEEANTLRFDDAGGTEQFMMRAKRNMDTSVGNDESHSVTQNQTVSVGVDRNTAIGGASSLTVGAGRTVSVTGDQTVTISENRKTTIGLEDSCSAGTVMSYSAGDKLELICGAASITLYKSGLIEITGDKLVTTTTNNTHLNAKEIHEESTNLHKIATTRIETGSTANTVMTAQKMYLTTGEKVKVTSSLFETVTDDVEMNATNLTINAKNTKIVGETLDTQTDGDTKLTACFIGLNSS